MKFAYKNSSGQFDARRLFVSLCMFMAFSWSGWAVALPVTPQLAAGGNHTVHLQRDGTLWAWGANGTGQLGDGTLTLRTGPVQITAASDWQAISAGGSFTLAIKANGTLWSWGQNNFGQLGDGTTTDRNTPVQVGTDTDWHSVAAGAGHVLALKKNRTLWTWGWNYLGQLGNGNFATRPGDGNDANVFAPMQIGSATDWVAIVAGGVHSAGIKSNGTLWMWGGNYSGQLGLDIPNDLATTPTQAGSSTAWKAVALGGSHSLALQTDGSLWSAGANYFGQLCLAGASSSDRRRFTNTSIGFSTTLIAAGENHTAFKGDYSVWGCGFNNRGQLGDGTQINSDKAVNTLGAGGAIVLGAGANHTIALDSSERINTWGNNASGQLGDGTQIDKWSPHKINVAPIVTEFPDNLVIDSVPYQYRFSVIDPDGSAVQRSALVLPAWLSFDTESGVLSGTPTLSDVGTQQVVLTVSDGALTKKFAFAITVNRNILHDQMISLSFNEGIGNETTDGSFSAFTASLSSVKWGPSFKGRSLGFNAAGYATVADNNALDLNTAFTLEAWVNPTANTQNTYFIAKNFDAAQKFAYGLGMRAGSLHATINNVIYKSSYVVPRSKWTHVAATWNGNTLKLFANGAQVFSMPVSGPLATNTQRLLIGARNAHGTGFAEGFVGAIDEVQLWKIALSPQALCLEAGRMWNGSACTGEVFNNLTPTANSATFNTTTGNVLYGTLRVTNLDGEPLTFSVVSSPNIGTVQITDPATGAFRYVPTKIGIDAFSFRVVDYFGLSTPATVNINVTSGVAIDSDGDGMKDITEAQHGLNPASAADGPQDKDHDGLSNYNEVIANRNPTIPFETDALHVLGMSFREGSGTAPRDATSAANHGTFNGTKAKWSAGPFGNAFNTTATAGVTIPDKASLDITGALSIELWIKPITSNQTSYLVAKNSDTGAATFDYGFAIGGGKLRAILTGNTYTSGYIVPVNEWTHVSLTWDGAKVRLYANGNLVYTGNRTAALTANNKPVVIGARNTPAGALTQGFTGELDQVNVWRRSLSGSEVCTASGGVLNASMCAH